MVLSIGPAKRRGWKGPWCTHVLEPRWLSQWLCLLCQVPRDSDMLYINHHDSGSLWKDCQNCLVLIIMNLSKLSSWRVPWWRNLAKNQHLGTAPSCRSVYRGLFPEVANVRAGREATRSGGYLLGVHMEIRNCLVLSSFFLNDVGLILPLFTCASQQTAIEINILHWLWWICTGPGGRLKTLCS